MTLYYEPWTHLTDTQIADLLSDGWYETVEASSPDTLFMEFGRISRTMLEMLNPANETTLGEDTLRDIKKLRAAMLRIHSEMYRNLLLRESALKEVAE